MKRKGPTFRIGDKAVYPAYGVGVIERIEKKEISGAVMSFYMLRILDRDMTIMIPTNNIENAGLREIISKDKVKKVYNIFKKRDAPIDTQTWNRRYREYKDKIRTGSIYEVAEVLRDLNLLKSEKVLSFGERQMLNTARILLIKELALAKGVSEREIEEDLKNFFK